MVLVTVLILPGAAQLEVHTLVSGYISNGNVDYTQDYLKIFDAQGGKSKSHHVAQKTHYYDLAIELTQDNFPGLDLSLCLQY